MPKVVCDNCGKTYYTKPSQLVRADKHYCSRVCQHDAQKTGEIKKCHICNKEIWRIKKEISRNKSGLFFCSKKCSMTWKNSVMNSGENHYLWNGGISFYRRKKEGLSDIIICEECGINDRRVLVVHHLDLNRHNNEPENLIWLCRNCHYLIHKGQTI